MFTEALRKKIFEQALDAAQKPRKAVLARLADDLGVSAMVVSQWKKNGVPACRIMEIKEKYPALPVWTEAVAEINRDLHELNETPKRD